MTGAVDSINAGVRKFVVEGLGTGLDGNSDVVISRLDNFLRVLMMESLRVLQKESNMVTMLMLVDVLLVR